MNESGGEKAGSGLDAEGRWTPAFPGQRPPFEPGNDLSLKAGDRALLRLRPRAAEIAEQLRELVPLWSPAFQPALEAAALVAARVEASFAGLADAVDQESVRWLDERASRWVSLYARYLAELGLTPQSLAQRGLDLSQAARSEQLRRHLEERAVESLIEQGKQTRAGREQDPAGGGSGGDGEPGGAGHGVLARRARTTNEGVVIDDVGEEPAEGGTT